MNNAIENLLKLYKVDNSKATTDMMAKALSLLGHAVFLYSQGINDCKKEDYYTNIAFHAENVTFHAKETLQKIQAITEGE